MPSLDPTPSVRSGPGLLGALLGVLFAIIGFVLMVVCAAAATLWHLRRRLREPAA